MFRGGAPSDRDYLRNGFFANSSLITCRGEAAIVDTPMLSPLAEPVLASLAGRPLHYLINTHGHLDHHLTNVLFSAAEIVQSEATARYLASFEDYIAYYLGLAEYQPVADELRKLRIVPATRQIREPQVLPLGDTIIEVHPVQAGETADSLVAFLPEARILFVGDMVYHEVHPFVGDIDRIEGWIQALEWLKGFDSAWCIPGHGQPFQGKAGFDQQIRYLETFSAQFQHLRGKCDTPKELKRAFDLGPLTSFAMRKTFLEFSLDCLMKGYPPSTLGA